MYKADMEWAGFLPILPEFLDSGRIPFHSAGIPGFRRIPWIPAGISGGLKSTVILLHFVTNLLHLC
jgi:hypothetical protein